LLKHHRFVAFSHGDKECHWLAVAVTTQVKLGAKASFAVSQCFADGMTVGCACSVLMGTNYTTIDKMQLSVKLSCCVCALLQTIQNLLPNPRLRQA
jgi:hypothetical protein